MDLFSTYNKNNSFFLKMSDYAGSSFDNEAAMGQRMSLIYIDSGSGIAKINHTSVAYMAPCVFCINEQEHIVIPDSKENVLMVLYFHPCIINSSLTFDILRKLPDDISLTLMQDSSLLKLFVNRADNYIGKFNLGPLSAKQFTTLYSNIHELINIQADINWPCRSRSYLMWLLFLLQNLYDKGMFSDDTLLGEVNEKLAPILQYIYNNYEKKITIADITGNFYISKTTLAKLFGEQVGCSFHTYINKLRITMASTMLRDTMLPINEIMTRVGFCDTVHFLRTFKKYTGDSPSEYRKKYNWM